ncbi:TraI/MobA(P) family conjugative relaxase [Ferrovum myxofaciens]|uniref:TraI/MobA(P) family conjugative relaxase n=1 Tax=Ferrovum myxofaciens TaxID=416213 RepID=UPI00068F502F|nr:TraI/MobA(P) family conjugative relaxase [Ferrovum myxofaciens]
MIAKVITLKHSSGSKGFDPVLRYIMRADPECGLAEDVRIEAGHFNVADDELYFGHEDERAAYADDLACEFNYVDSMCRKQTRFNGNPVYHVAINWQEDEHPTPEQAEHASKYIMQALGYADHQAAWAIHRDTDNDHVHLVINRVHPLALKAISPPFKKDYVILDRCMRELEIEFGHKRANGPYITLDTNDGPKIVRMSRAERRERGLLKEDDSPRLTRGAAAAEYRFGTDSFQSWVAKNPAHALKQTLGKQSATWQDVHMAMAQHGVAIQLKGSGMIVTTILDDGRVLAAKASQLGRWASRAELEKTLGAYEPPATTPAAAPNIYQRQMVEQQRKEVPEKAHEAFHASRARDPDERAIRRQARADARQDLADRFKTDQESIRTTKPEQRQALRERHDQERKVLMAQQRLMRGEAKAEARKNGKSPELALSIWAYQTAMQREELQKRQASERKSLTAKLPRAEVWRTWLEKQAQQGDEAALAALRGIRHREQRAKNKQIDGIEGEEVDPLRRRTLAGLDAQIDQRRQLVIYRGQDGREKFTDTGPRIVMHDKADDSLEAALRLAAQKYGGKVDITGSSDFRERAARQAVRLGIKVTNTDLQAVVADEQAKRQASQFNGKDYQNERPNYERIKPERTRRGQRAAAVYQSGLAHDGSETPPESLASVRNLSGIRVVHHERAQVFLQSNAPDRVGSERAADPEMRRPGAGAAENSAGTGIVADVSTKSVDNSATVPDKTMNKELSDALPKKQAKRPEKRKDADLGR